MVRAVDFQVFGLGCRVYIGLLVSFLPPAFTGFMLSRKTPVFSFARIETRFGPHGSPNLEPRPRKRITPLLVLFRLFAC